jgi:uncharacterized protein (AIM24 family)
VPVYELINEKMLSVKLQNDDVLARRGSMIAYTGQVNFAPNMLGNEGMQGAAMRAVTNERIHLMRATGQGEVLYAQHGLFVTIITLQGEKLYIESDNVLVFDGRLRSGTEFQGNAGVQGLVRGAASGQGLWTTTFEGHGEVAMLSDGDAIGLDVTPEQAIFVDPNAYLGHKGMLQSQFVTDVNWKTMIGQGSGESFQLKFTGQGTVYIQASER